MANVDLVQRPRGVVARLAWWYSRRIFGQVVEPTRAAARHRGVTMAWGALELAAEKSWGRLDAHVRYLAVQASAGATGCSWCVDFGYYEGLQQGVDQVKVHDLPRWRDSDAYDERERSVLEYAEAATGTPAIVTDALVERLHRHFSDEELVELAAWVALENFRSRFNAGLGLHSEGFARRCDIGASAVRS